MVVAGFGWDRTFERLLGEIYPAAMAVSADRVARRTANRFASARPSLPAGLVTA
jgi:hypothetical protein